MIHPQLRPQSPKLTRGEDDWRLQGACRTEDAELFFTVDTGKPDPLIDRAKQVCAGCPVKDLCLAWYTTIPDDHAIAGGTTPRERNGALPRAAHAARMKDAWNAKRHPCARCGEPCSNGSVVCGECLKIQQRAERAERSAWLRAKAADLRSQGLEVSFIAQLLGVNGRTVARYLREAS